MFKNAVCSGFLSVLYSENKNPLELWDKQVREGQVKRIVDEDTNSKVLEVLGKNVGSTYLTCPKDARDTLGIRLSHLVLILKNVKKYVSVEVQIVDDKHTRRRFKAANYYYTTRTRPLFCTMPLRLEEGWNQVALRLSDMTLKAFGTRYVETVRVRVHANCRLRRIYFSDRMYTSMELPNNYRLYPEGQTVITKRKNEGKRQAVAEKDRRQTSDRRAKPTVEVVEVLLVQDKPGDKP